MSLSTQPYKGARDFYPEDKRLQEYIFGVWRKVAHSYGYEEYDAPILEPLELYTAKTGEEIVHEQTYAFTDRGGREIAIRPEMTPSVSRMVAAQRQELAYPLRWFSIPNLWRYEQPQRGRLREHWQLNVDIFGEAGLAAEHEMIQMANDILKAFKAKPAMYQIRLNSRRLMDYLLLERLGLSHVQAQTLSKLIDRMHKLDPAMFRAAVEALCTPSQREAGVPARVFELLAVKDLGDLKPEALSHEAAQELQLLMELLRASGIDNAVFDVTLMRGFDYYDNIVFEVFDTHPDNNRSMFGGGRYNGLVGLFGVDSLPTVGFGMGDVTFTNFLVAHRLLPTVGTKTDMTIIPIGDVYLAASKLAARFRKMGVNVSLDATDRKIDKKLKSLTKQQVRYALFVGADELKEERYPLKDLVTGKEEKHSLERTVTLVKDYRKHKASK